ncbi:hypothetical protein BDB00DRAFT_856434 [Zychaea mexicana]|uniref:uncharacterized protein n=1 Tax=Zychaea mexicana TaxID=64656 RepID=UPI0022FEC223|nr:uncharacterized protein BDB00DRAFT_856434 [Zychaea mexicana]KAI9484303.1 hypothetical protein BDB00DRAFT_856434 [Zychaea mexicana]
MKTRTMIGAERVSAARVSCGQKISISEGIASPKKTSLSRRATVDQIFLSTQKIGAAETLTRSADGCQVAALVPGTLVLVLLLVLALVLQVLWLVSALPTAHLHMVGLAHLFCWAKLATAGASWLTGPELEAVPMR